MQHSRYRGGGAPADQCLSGSPLQPAALGEVVHGHSHGHGHGHSHGHSHRGCSGHSHGSGAHNGGGSGGAAHGRAQALLSGTGALRVVLSVRGHFCQQEAEMCRSILADQGGVRGVWANVVARSLTVDYDPPATPERIVAALRAEHVDAAAGLPQPTGWLPPPKLLVATGLLLLPLAAHCDERLEPLEYLSLAALAIALPPVARRAAASLQRRLLDVNVLLTVAVCGACLLGELHEAAEVAVTFSVADWLEERATERARSALSSLLDLRPDTAVLDDDGELEVPAEQVAVGAVVRVRCGARVPVDGEVCRGESTVDESMLTGEARAVPKGPGDVVSAGTVNSGGGCLAVRATAPAADSAVGRLLRLVEEAQSQRAPAEQFIDRIAWWYTPMIVVTAAAFATIPPLWGAAGTDYVKVSLVMLLIACPCALVISTPVTYVCGLARAARSGLLVKGGRHLEALGRLRVCAFDKTGTLTEGRFAVRNFCVAPSAVRAEVLALAAAVERLAQHPMARALCEYADAELGAGAAAPGALYSAADCSAFAVVPGEGVSAVVGGRAVCLGNRRLLQRLREVNPFPETAAWEEAGDSVGWIAVQGTVVAAFSAADAVRPEAAAALMQLEREGVRAVILTGDSAGAAERVRRQCGLLGTQVRAELLPQHKLQAVRDYTYLSRTERIPGAGAVERAVHRVFGGSLAMVGDGVNDAPALAAADVGVAIGATGTQQAMDTADVILMGTDLRLLAEAASVGRACITVVIQNVVFSLLTKAVVVVWALCGGVSLFAAVLTDVGAMLAVTLNGLRVLSHEAKAARGEKHAGCGPAAARRTDPLDWARAFPFDSGATP